MGAKHWNRSLEPEQRKGPASNFIRYTEMMGSIPPKQVPRSKLPRWASRRVMNIPRGDPPRLHPFPAACSRTQQHPTFAFALHLPPQGSKKNTKNLCLSPSPAADPLLLAACCWGAEQGTSSLWRPRRRLPAPRPPRAPGQSPLVPWKRTWSSIFIYLFIFFSTVHNTFVENEFLFS